MLLNKQSKRWEVNSTSTMKLMLMPSLVSSAQMLVMILMLVILMKSMLSTKWQSNHTLTLVVTSALHVLQVRDHLVTTSPVSQSTVVSANSSDKTCSAHNVTGAQRVSSQVKMEQHVLREQYQSASQTRNQLQMAWDVCQNVDHLRNFTKVIAESSVDQMSTETETDV